MARDAKRRCCWVGCWVGCWVSIRSSAVVAVSEETMVEVKTMSYSNRQELRGTLAKAHVGVGSTPPARQGPHIKSSWSHDGP